MLIEQSFTVPAPPDELWSTLLDVERIAPCMPGAELTEVVDDRNWKGKLKAKFGPVAMTFAGTVTMTERDDDARRVVLTAQGMESKGKGAANAQVTSWLEASPEGSTVHMQADITLSGFVAQVSRGLLPDVSARLTQQFADCLKVQLEQQGASAAGGAGGGDGGSTASTTRGTAPGGGSSPTNTTPGATPGGGPSAAVADPVGGLRLGLWALFRALGRAIGRLFGKKYDD